MPSMTHKRTKKDEEEVIESEDEKENSKKIKVSKNKRFTDKWRQDLLAFMKRKPCHSVGDSLQKFADDHDFTISQVRHNWYEVLAPQVKKKKNKDLQKLDDGAGNEKRSTEITTVTAEETSVEDDNSDFKSPNKVVDLGKVTTKPEINLLKPFRFETDKNRFYVFRYPTHLQFTFKGISCSDKTFEIEVTTRSQFNGDMLVEILGGYYDLKNLQQENTSRESSELLFTLTESIPKDVDYKSVQIGEHTVDDFGPAFIVVFDKKVKTFVPSVVYASWSKPIVDTPKKSIFIVKEKQDIVDKEFEKE